MWARLAREFLHFGLIFENGASSNFRRQREYIVARSTKGVWERSMRVVLSTVTAMVLVAGSVVPALCQVDGFGHVIKENKPVEYHQPSRNDKAYQSALDRIPDSKDKYDPWGNVRQQPSSGTAAPK
jgi:hypothetical protein